MFEEFGLPIDVDDDARCVRGVLGGADTADVEGFAQLALRTHDGHTRHSGEQVARRGRLRPFDVLLIDDGNRLRCVDGHLGGTAQANDQSLQQRHVRCVQIGLRNSSLQRDRPQCDAAQQCCGAALNQPHSITPEFLCVGAGWRRLAGFGSAKKNYDSADHLLRCVDKLVIGVKFS